MKLIRVHETTEDEPVNWGNNAELKTTEEKYLRALKQETSMRHQCEVFLHSILPYEKELIKAIEQYIANGNGQATLAGRL